MSAPLLFEALDKQIFVRPGPCKRIIRTIPGLFQQTAAQGVRPTIKASVTILTLSASGYVVFIQASYRII